MAAMEVPEIAIVPSPGMGHLIPCTEFAKLLVSRFNLSVSLLIPNVGQPQPTEAQSSFLNSLPSGISHTFLPPVDPAHLPDGAPIDLTISLIVTHSIPSIQAELAQRPNIVALVTDLFGSSLFDVAREWGIPPYMYLTCSAMYLLFCFYLHNLDETLSSEFKDIPDPLVPAGDKCRGIPDPLVLPGCVSLRREDFEVAVQNRENGAYKRYVKAEGIFVNTFLELESGALRTLHMGDPKWPPVYPIGPIIQSGSTHSGEGSGSECLKWLDQQPSGSVLFVSFGSGGTLTHKQLIELAIGLEKSGLRFLWVVKRPNDESSSGSYLSGLSQEDGSFDFLPKGFVDRTMDRGLLVHNWAPQIEVLRHGSIGGFLTHCGWNSTLESLVHGVALITWPLFAEQKMNATILNESLRVGLRPNVNEHGVVEADEIAKAVKDLMEGAEGEKARYNIKELSDSAKMAISEHGNSSVLFEKVVLKWTQN